MGPTLTITAKGQVTLRKDVLAHLGAGPGDRLEVDLLPDGTLRLRPKRGKPITDIFGLLAGRRPKPLSIEEINDLTRTGWAGER